MSSAGEYLEKTLWDLATVFVVIGLMFGMFCFCTMGPMDFIQSLPLFRLDRSDAGWFAICCAVYFIPFCLACYVAFICIAVPCIIIAKVAVLFYKHVILEPMRAVIVTITGAIIVWMVIFSYENLVAIFSSLS